MRVGRFIIKTMIVFVFMGIMFVLGSFSYLYLDSIGILNGYENYKFQENLQRAKNKYTSIEIKDLVEFDWQYVCVFAPYSGNLDSLMEDGFWSVAFHLNDRGIKKFKINRGVADLDAALSNKCFNSNSIFIFTNKDSRIYVTIQ